MKKLLVGLMMVAMGLLLITPMASAYPVAAGDWITITDAVGGSNGLGGGAFNIAKTAAPANILFDTFCVERNEYFTPGGSYYIGSITNAAINGGIAGGNPDPLSSQAAYLYSQWATGLVVKNDASANAYQLAIWAFEDEYTNPPTNAAALLLYNQAIATVGNSTSLYGVSVMNLYGSTCIQTIGGVTTSFAACTPQYKQDMLVYNGVPEPATMLLFGLGLLGLAGIRRKIKK